MQQGYAPMPGQMPGQQPQRSGPVEKTRMTREWIAQVVRENNTQVLPNGNIRTPPVRLSFPNLFKPQANKDNPQAEPKFNSALLFQEGSNMQPFYDAAMGVIHAIFPEAIGPNGQIYGLTLPFHDQGEKAMKLDGYIPGRLYMNVSSKYRPPIVDVRQIPIMDESKVYPGVWAILTLNAYAYGKSPPRPKKGPGFGIQAVMIVADDDSLGGGGSANPAQEFAGVNITQNTNMGQFFGGAPQPAAGGPMIPGMGGAPFAPGVAGPMGSGPTQYPAAPGFAQPVSPSSPQYGAGFNPVSAADLM